MEINTQWNREFANRCHDARIAAGLSQAQAARLLRVSQPYVSMVESGDRMVDAPLVSKMCDVYAVSGDWLLGLKDESDLPPELIAQTQKLPPADRYKLRKLLAMMD